jgi:hypothetical protein
MKGIAQAQIVLKKGTAEVLVDLPVITAHGGGGIQKQNQVPGFPLLAKDQGKRPSNEDKPQ